MDVEIGYVESGPARIYFEVAGEGPALVLIHAGVADSRQWDNEFQAFAPDHRVLRYDLRGYGRSLPAEGEFSHMEDLKSVLEALAFTDPVVLLGCSMGGTLAMDYALEYPSHVRGLVMVGSGPSGLDLDVPDHPKEHEAEKAHHAGDLDLLAELEAQIWFDGMDRSPQQVDPAMRSLAIAMNRLALAHEAEGLGTRRPNTPNMAFERLDRLEVPVLIIVGGHDLPFMHAAADYMLERLPSAQGVILEDAAHLPNLDHPQQFEGAVRAFLRDRLG